MVNRAPVHKLGYGTNQNAQKSELKLVQRTGHPRKKVNFLERDEGKEDLHRPWYEVLCTKEPNGLYGERFLIDGTTGETLYIERDVYIDREGDGKYIEDMLAGRPVTIQEKYLYELNKKKGGQDKKGTKKKGKSFWRKLFD